MLSRPVMLLGSKIFAAMLLGVTLYMVLANALGGSSYALRATKPTGLRRDCGLVNLAQLLNEDVDWHPWQGHTHNISLATVRLFQQFLQKIEPWLTADPETPLRVTTRPVPLTKTLDCTSAQYKHVLSGKRMTQQRPIVDFVPFGYDLDLLEVRLYESQEAVDLFVVFEAPRNHKGLRKGLYFNQSLTRTKRFAPFMHKIIHVMATEDEMQHMLGGDRMKDGFTQSTGTKNPNTAWELENSQRKIPVNRLLKMKGSKLWDSIFSNKESIVLQNDGDELWNGEALYHLKHCELKEGMKWPIHALPTSMKKNFNWLQKNNRMGACGPFKEAQPLVEYLWHLGPSAFPLKWALDWKEIRRPGGSPDCENNFGIGGGVHISSVAEPSAYWHKRAGVIDQEFGTAFGRPAMDPRLIEAGLQRSV